MILRSALAVACLSVTAFSAYGQEPELDTQECALTRAMDEKRAEVRSRNSEMTKVGIEERNSTVIDNMPTIQEGACLDQIYKVMESIQNSMQSPMGSIISKAYSQQIANMINNMTCREAERYYKEVMGTKLAELDDRFGLIGSGGQVTGYDEGKTTSIDVGKAIEMGREAAGSVRNLPSAPPGRAPASSSGPSSAPSSEGVRNAINGL
ncbi:MAG: hypothetical protein V7693_16230 [Halopseudomonas sabulinigri]